MSDESSSPKPPVRRTRLAESADAISDAGVKIARLSPQQMLSLVAIISLGFICSLQAFQVYSEREERKTFIRDQQDARAAQMRENNAQVELMRQHCASTERENRSFYAEQDERRMRHEAEQREKDRAVLTNLGMKISDLERAIRKVP